MELTISSIPELQKYASSGHTHIVSLVDAEFTQVLHIAKQVLPDIVHDASHIFESYTSPFDRLELQFDDVTFESRFFQAPTHEDVEKILEFGRKLDDDSKLLVHCHAGISRSPAAAILLLMQMAPDSTADQILDRVLAVRPQAYPNRLILELGGRILNREDELMEMFKKRCSLRR